MSDRRRKRQEHREEHRERRHGGGPRAVAQPRPAWPVVPGWKVYTSDNATLGRVSEAPAGEPYFVVRRGLIFRTITLYVPMRAVRGSTEKEGGYVLLRATKHEALGWRHAPTGRREQAEAPASHVVELERPVEAAPDAPTKRAARRVEVPRRPIPSIPVRDPFAARPVAPALHSDVAALAAPAAPPSHVPEAAVSRTVEEPLAPPEMLVSRPVPEAAASRAVAEPRASQDVVAPPPSHRPVVAPTEEPVPFGAAAPHVAEGPPAHSLVGEQSPATPEATPAPGELEDAALRRFSERVHQQEAAAGDGRGEAR